MPLGLGLDLKIGMVWDRLRLTNCSPFLVIFIRSSWFGQVNNPHIEILIVTKKLLTRSELLQLLTSNFNSILSYNSEIWLINSLKQTLKNKLLSASARVLKICMNSPDVFKRLHEFNHWAHPDKYMRQTFVIIVQTCFC